jgi:hypothetical protein
MDIPSDQLTKFAAVAGILMAITSAGFGLKIFMEGEAALQHVEDLRAPITIVYEQVEDRRQKARQREHFRRCKQSDFSNLSELTECLQEQIKEMTAFGAVLDETLRADEKDTQTAIEKKVLLETYLNQLHREMRDYKLLLIASAVGVALGTVLSFVGFVGWARLEKHGVA